MNCFRVNTHLFSVFVEFTDLLSFPLHFQKQLLLLPLKLSSFLLSNTSLQLPNQLILFSAKHVGTDNLYFYIYLYTKMC